MPTIQRKSLLAVSAAALVLGLAACDSADDRIAATHESAASQTEQVAKDSRDQTRETAREAREETGEAARETRKDAREATVAADASMDRAAQDTRAMGAAAANKVDDASITAKVNAALAADKELSALRVDVDTRDGVVTLSGPAPTASAKERAAELALKVKGVASVNNQLTIKAG
ncbi:MAG TPA: BON domain-containing protein [Ramlibacter sp.]